MRPRPDFLTSARGMCWRSLLALSIAAATARATPSPASTAAACDTDFVRTQAQRSVPEYQVEAVRAERGVVTLLFTAPHGGGTFAIALRAVGTQLSTSVMGVRLDQAELARLSKPVTLWWEHAEIQRALAACSAAPPDAGVGDPGPVLRAAVQAALRLHDRPGPWPGPVDGLVGAAWIAFGLLLFSGNRLSAHTRVPKRALLGLFGFSLLLHWLLCSGGPGDLRLNLASIWSSPALELRWGPAPIALFRLLALVLGGIRDTHIVWVNLILSSLLPILMYRIVSELGVSEVAALLAAGVAAAHPLLIVFSGVLERQPAYLFAAFGSILGLIVFLKRGGMGAFIAFVLGTVLAVTSRPEGAHVLIVQLAVLLVVSASRRRRAFVALALALLIPLTVAYIRYALEYGAGLAGLTTLTFPGPGLLLWTVAFSRDFTPLAWTIGWILGLVLGIRRRAAWVAIAALLGLHIVWASTGLYEMFVGYERQVASARYESILLFPIVIGMALFIEAGLEAGTGLRITLAAIFVAFTAVTFRRPYDTLLRPFTVDYEYQFLKRHALTLPARSHLYVLQSPLDDVGFIDAMWVGQFVGSAVSFGLWIPHAGDDLPGDSPDTYLYIGSSCAALLGHPNRPLGPDFARWLQDCTAIRARVAGSTVEEIEVPARKMSWHEYKERTVRLGLYRLK